MPKKNLGAFMWVSTVVADLWSKKIKIHGGSVVNLIT